MKRNVWFIAMGCMCLVLAVFLLACKTGDKDVKPARASFVPSPVARAWSHSALIYL